MASLQTDLGNSKDKPTDDDAAKVPGFDHLGFGGITILIDRV